MIKVIHTMALNGINGIPVVVESSCVGSPSPRLDIIGLPDAAVKEAAGRVRAAARSSGLPLHNGVLTVNLAPADVRKEGSSFDLPILLSLVNTDAAEKADFSDKCFAGELSLTGEVKPIYGALSMAISARDMGYRQIYLPEANAAEASAAEGIEVYPVKDVRSLYAHLTGEHVIQPVPFPTGLLDSCAAGPMPDFADIKGQEAAKTALELAAAGGHNVLMIGPPGSGKSMLASRMPSILPPMTVEEAIETTKIHSVAGTLPPGVSLITSRPFRSPHHTLSCASLAGGGKNPRPGEISLAHNGVLFLDEFPEFDRTVSETLRQPLEEREVHITRVSGTVTYPCSFILICAMNPCKCGYYGHPTKPCVCTQKARLAYTSRISGPLLDRIDIHVEVPALEYYELASKESAEPSAAIRERVIAARKFTAERTGGAVLCNGLMTPADIRRFCRMSGEAEALMKAAFAKLSLSARAYDRILKVARTAADFDRSDMICRDHIGLALQLRSTNKKYWS